MRDECFQFDSTKHHTFSPGTPVLYCIITLDELLLLSQVYIALIHIDLSALHSLV
jgi:hypothetical protein